CHRTHAAKFTCWLPYDIPISSRTWVQAPRGVDRLAQRPPTLGLRVLHQRQPPGLGLGVNPSSQWKPWHCGVSPTPRARSARASRALLALLPGFEFPIEVFLGDEIDPARVDFHRAVRQIGDVQPRRDVWAVSVPDINFGLVVNWPLRLTNGFV